MPPESRLVGRAPRHSRRSRHFVHRLLSSLSDVPPKPDDAPEGACASTEAAPNLAAALEALLFSHGAPVTAERLAEALDTDAGAVQPALDELEIRYSASDSGLRAGPDCRGLPAHDPDGMAGGHRAPHGPEAGAGPHRAGDRGAVGNRLPATDHRARVERDSRRELPKRHRHAHETSPDPLPGTQAGGGTSAPLRDDKGVPGAVRTGSAGGSSETPRVRGCTGGGRSGAAGGQRGGAGDRCRRGAGTGSGDGSE